MSFFKNKDLHLRTQPGRELRGLKPLS